MVRAAPVIAKVDMFKVAPLEIESTPATEKPTPAVTVPLLTVRLLNEVNIETNEFKINIKRDAEQHFVASAPAQLAAPMAAAPAPAAAVAEAPVEAAATTPAEPEAAARG